MVEFIKEVQLLAIRSSVYTTYVFKVIKENEYVMCTKLPNWQVPEINVGDVGFLQYQIVKAGDLYVTPEGDQIAYKYSNVYFINFVLKTDAVMKKEVIL